MAIFITAGQKLKSFEYLEKEWIDTDYGVTGMVRERQGAYSGKHTRDLVLGTAICIISLIPLFLLIALSGDDDLTAVTAVLPPYSVRQVASSPVPYVRIHSYRMSHLS